ncbi:FH2 domain-containing protein 1 [Clonorchis sinensis]|uniref:FH2 domain-containing protein 1 n=1 Tax=Clonorchis sinensis TaxID=79923 RepID=A0A8T1MUF8_CLOSI|nr:FH2 domain-containing protein 1 [Clonorchis sinensis]
MMDDKGDLTPTMERKSELDRKCENEPETPSPFPPLKYTVDFSFVCQASANLSDHKQVNSEYKQEVHCLKTPTGSVLFDAVCNNHSTPNKESKACEDRVPRNSWYSSRSEWVDQTFCQIRQRAHSDPIVGLYFNIFLCHLVKLVVLGPEKHTKMHKNQREPCESTQHSRSLDLWKSLIEVIHTALCYTAEQPESHGLAQYPPESHGLSQYVKCLQTSQPNSPKWQSKNRSGQNTTCNYLLLEDRSPSNKTLGIDIRTKTPTSVNGVVQISHPQIRTSKKNGTEPMKLQHRETSTSATAVDSDTTTSNGPPFPPPPPVLIIEPPPFFCPSKKPCQLNNSNSCSALSEVRSEISRPTSFRLKPLRWLKLKTVCSNSVWSLKSRTPSDCMVTQSDRLPLTNSSLVDFQQLIRLFPVTSKDHSENKSGNAPSMTTTDQRRFEQISISRNRMNESTACDLTNGVDNYQDTAAAQTEDISALPNPFIRGRALSQSRNSDMTAKKPRLLDNKRCLNVNIYLRQFKSVSFSLIDAIDNRWSTLIGAERLRALVKLLPSEPEVGTFRSFSGDVETLDPAEKFLIELVTVSNYKQKIDHMLLREEFHSCSHWFGPALDKLLETVKALITSETLCGLLHLVLDLGNFLNEGKSFGAATAFKIESLLKLSDVRSINPKFTLLHFLVQHVQQHYPQYLSVRQEFPHIKESCGICTEAISKEIQKLQYRLKVMINQVGQEDDPPEDLLTFIETAKNEMDQLEARMVRLTELTNQCADYFSEERSSFRLTSCLQTFSTFFTKMDCAEQELRQMDLQQKKARQTEEGLCECDPTLEITIMQRTDLQAINDCLEVLPISVSFIMKIYKN